MFKIYQRLKSIQPFFLMGALSTCSAIAQAECETSYNLNGDGSLSLPCVELLNMPSRTVYQAQLKLVDSQNFLFQLQNYSALSTLPSATGALYDGASGTLSIPVLSLINGGQSQNYNVTLQMNSNGLFAVTGATPSNSDGNNTPVATDISLNADPDLPYQEINLIATDSDGDSLVYELLSASSGEGYTLAYINPLVAKIYVTLASGFSGTINLSYRVSDGQNFSDPANIAISVGSSAEQHGTGMDTIDAQTYAQFDTSYLDSGLLGAPGAAPTLPTSVDLSANFPIPGNQGQQNSCVGWATAYALKSYHEKLENQWSLNTNDHLFSPSFIYNQINRGQDLGSLPNEALDLLVNSGAATLNTMDYSQNDYLTQPSAAAFNEAANFKAKSWEVPRSLNDIKAALANNLPVLIGIGIYDSFNYVSGTDAVYNSASGQPLGGHAVTAVGYDDNKYGGAFKVINSYGQNWGDGGYFWLPYSFATSTPTGQNQPILLAAFVVKDADNTNTADAASSTETSVTTHEATSITEPTPTGALPNLEVQSWTFNYEGKPGGQGLLQFQVANTGTGTAVAGSTIALVLSQDGTITSNDTLVVYEQIPYDLAPGEYVYRDANTAISFNLPSQLPNGTYYAGLWVDVQNQLTESNENDNISYADSTLQISSTEADLQIDTWYTEWDFNGTGYLIYQVSNVGASDAAAGWDLNLVLSSDAVIGNGDEMSLFTEYSTAAMAPGQYVYRDVNSLGYYSLYTTANGFSVPSGTYYMALWVNATGAISESVTSNNYSLSGGTVSINGLRSRTGGGKAYNGKQLPKQVVMKKVEIIETDGKRSLRILDRETIEEQPLPKQVKAANPTIFPLTKGKEMPQNHSN